MRAPEWDSVSYHWEVDKPEDSRFRIFEHHYLVDDEVKGAISNADIVKYDWVCTQTAHKEMLPDQYSDKIITIMG